MGKNFKALLDVKKQSPKLYLRMVKLFAVGRVVGILDQQPMKGTNSSKRIRGVKEMKEMVQVKQVC